MSPVYVGGYPTDWPEIARSCKARAGWRCERCGHPHEPASGHTLTVHHLDWDKGNCEDWNLAALCQRCCLTIQAKADMGQPFMFDHTGRMMPHVEGYLEAMWQRGRYDD